LNVEAISAKIVVTGAGWVGAGKERVMKKFFNTAGLCFPEKHYMVDPLRRLSEVEALVEKELYFTIHAPRQTGKTTYLYALAQKLNIEKNHIALVVSFERVGLPNIPLERANEILIDSVFNAAIRQLPEPDRPPDPTNERFLELKNYLELWSRSQEKPIVLLIDEIDALVDHVLVSVLRQLRDGYQGRPKHFPAAIALVGLRDVRDYRADIRSKSDTLGTASPFNIKSDSLFLPNFSDEEVFDLLEKHTEATGQEFPLEVKNEIIRLTGGQPWLTNALANQIVSRILSDDHSQKITLEVLVQARRDLILRRDTHLDSLVDKLREDRVKRIVQAIINGESMMFDILDDDIAYVRDLGIVSPSSPLKFSNPIYAEIIPHVMASAIQESIPEEIQPPVFIDEEGHLDMPMVLRQFQEFYRRNSEAWRERYLFKESAHHLLLMAFLQRVINSGGDIIREMAVGNGRIDLLVRFKGREYALELKVLRNNRTTEEGLEQLDRYLDRLGLTEGFLVLFDPTDKDWNEKIFYRPMTTHNKKIILIGV